MALAGFAAVALVLGQREGALPSGSAYVVQFMVINALGPALIALLAAVLFAMNLPEPMLFRICSGIYLVSATYFAALSVARERSLSKAGELVLPATISRGLWIGSFLAHAVQMSNLIGFPAGPSLGVFLLGLWILLLMASIQFVALLFLSFR